MYTQKFGIIGVKNVTLTMTVTTDEEKQAQNSEGAVVVGKVMDQVKRRIGRDTPIHPVP